MKPSSSFSRPPLAHEPLDKTLDTLKEGTPLNAEDHKIQTGEEEPTPEESRRNEKKIFQAALINTTELMENQVRDIADGRMTESREDRTGNWFKKQWNRIWKHDLAQEYYRQREIARARNEILSTDNIYAGDKEVVNSNESREAMNAIIDRFTHEYRDDMLTEHERRSITEERVANDEINALIRRYADPTVNPPMSDAAFQEEKTRILSEIDPNYRDHRRHNRMYADNLHEIAQNVRQSVAEGQTLNLMDVEVQFTLGQTRGRLQTAAHHNAFDSVVEKAQNSKIGKYIVNTPSLIAAAGGIYSALKYAGFKVARSDIAKVASFGGTAVLAGGLAASKEAARLNRERALHQRERAKGVTFEGDDMRRREAMERNSYETKRAADVTAVLEADIATIAAGNVNEETMRRIMGNLADLDARAELGEHRRIDLVTYSSLKDSEREGMALELAKARLKNAIRQGVQANTLSIFEPTDLDTYLSTLTHTQSEVLMNGENGISKRDNTFLGMKARRTAWAFTKSAMIGAGIGATIQEIHALFSDELDGVFEHAKSGHATMLAALRRHFSHDQIPHMPVAAGPSHEAVFGDVKVEMPGGSDMIKNPDGTYTITRGGEVVVDHAPLKFDANGNLDEGSSTLLKKEGIFPKFTQTHEPVSTSTNAQDYINKHPGLTTKVHRHEWFDNDTKAFDKGELKQYWGGVNGTGINENGDYVFRAGMGSGDSFHGDHELDVPESLKHNGAIKLALSITRGTQHEVIFVDADAKGNAIIPKGSEIAKILFSTDANGHAVFHGKFAEFVADTGVGEDGFHNISMASTFEGTDDAESLLTSTTDKVTGHLRLDMSGPGAAKPWDYEMPYVIPVPGRRPLEAGQAPKKKAPVAAPIPVRAAPPVEEIPEVTPMPPVQIVETGPMFAEEDLEKLTREEYDALRDDLNLINKRIQSHLGIITINESDLKSKLGKKMWRELKDIPEGKGSGYNPNGTGIIGSQELRDAYAATGTPGARLTFNNSELRKIGDAIERALSKSEVEAAAADDDEDNADAEAEAAKKKENNTVSKEEYDALRSDMDFLNEKITKSQGIITVTRDDIKSKAALDMYLKLKDIPEGKGITFNKSELSQIGDMVESALSKAKIEEPGTLAPKKPEPKKTRKPVAAPTALAEEDDGPVIVPADEKIKTVPETAEHTAEEGVIDPEEFLEKDIPDIFKKVFAKYENRIKFPKDAFKNLVWKRRMGEVSVEGNINLKTKGKSGKFGDSKINGIKIVLEDDGTVNLLTKEYTFITTDESPTTRANIVEAMNDIAKEIQESFGVESES